MKRIKLFLIVVFGLLSLTACSLNQTRFEKPEDVISEGEESYKVTFISSDNGEVLFEVSKKLINSINIKDLPLEMIEGFDILIKDESGNIVDVSEIKETTNLYIYYERKPYVISYYANGVLVNSQDVLFGDAIELEECQNIPIGKEFIGWSSSKDEFVELDLEYMPAENISLYAFFQDKDYTITFVPNLSILDEEYTKTYKYNDKLGKVAPDELLAAIEGLNGFEFVGWYLDAELTQKFDKLFMPNEDLILYAKFNYPGVTFVAFNKVITIETGNVGEQVSFPEAPSVQGYEFVEWLDEDGNPVTEAFIGERPQSITASYSPLSNIQYKVEYYLQTLGTSYVFKETKEFVGTTDEEVSAEVLSYDGFSLDVNNQANLLSSKVKGDGSLVLKVYYSRNLYHLVINSNGETLVDGYYKFEQGFSYPTPVNKDGYTFTGWDYDEEIMPNRDLTIEALYTINQYNVKFVSDGLTVQEETLDFGSAITYPSDPEKEGYTFTGWDSNITSVPSHDVTIEALFSINQYNVKFVSDGLTIQEETLDFGAAITYPSDPEKEGYTFTGWDSNITSVPSHDVTIEALFSINQYNVKFVSNGLTVQEEILDFGAAITYPSDPEKEGYTFTGWDSNITSVPSHDVTIEALFSINQYNVKFVSNGETIQENTLDFGANITYPSDPEKEGYTFTGWDSNITSVPSHDVTIEALFSINQYNVKFVSDGLTIQEETLDFGAAITYPSDPEKEGYTFTGWDSNITSVPSHDVTIEALFSINQYDISADTGNFTIADLPQQAAHGSTVEFSVTANDGYAINQVFANGVALTEANGKYSFTITEATNISVTLYNYYSTNVGNDDYNAAGSNNLGGINWTLALTGEGVYFGGTTSRIQIGSKNDPASLITFSTNDVSGIIKKVIITTAAYNAEFSVYLNGQQLGETKAIASSTSATYEFSCDDSGELLLKWDNIQRAVYLEKIEIIYEYIDRYNISCEAGNSTVDNLPVKAFVNSEIEFTVTAKAGYVIDSVKLNDEVLTPNTEGKYTFTITEDVSIVVETIAVTPLFDISSDTGNFTIADLPLQAAEGSTVEFSVTANDGYAINQVFANGVALTEVNGKYSFTITEATNISVTLYNYYSYSLTSKVYSAEGSQDLGGLNWDLSATWAANSYFGSNSDRFQIGSGNNPATTIDFSTNDVSGIIKKVIVTTAGSSAELSVFVNGQQIGTTKTITTTTTAYEFTCDDSGELRIHWDVPSKAVYLAKVEVIYEYVPSYEISSNSGNFTINGLPAKGLENSEIEFTVTPNTYYLISSVKANDVVLTADNEGKYTFTLTEDASIVVETEDDPSYKSISLTKDANIEDVSLPAKGLLGDTIEFTVSAADGYDVDSVTFNGEVLTPNTEGKYSFTVADTNELNITSKVHVVAGDIYTITSSTGNYTITGLPDSAEDGTLVEFSVAALTGYIVTAVKANETALTPDNSGNYSFTITANTIIDVTVRELHTVSVTMSAQGYSNQEVVNQINLDSVITASFDKGSNSNTPKYFDNGSALRFYGGGTMTISAAEGYTIYSVKVTFTNSTFTNLSNNTADIVNAASKEYTVSGPNGHVRITVIEVVYY